MITMRCMLPSLRHRRFERITEGSFGSSISHVPGILPERRLAAPAIGRANGNLSDRSILATAPDQMRDTLPQSTFELTRFDKRKRKPLAGLNPDWRLPVIGIIITD